MIRLPQIRSAQFQSTSPYAGDDAIRALLSLLAFNISIHVPLRGGRQARVFLRFAPEKFQSTSPYAGDDKYLSKDVSHNRDFNPRPPTRGTTIFLKSIAAFTPFQSTSPYAGDDHNLCIILPHKVLFQSTSPYAGDDYSRRRILDAKIANFNPRPPTRGTTRIF